jgi:hypothetical protein
MVLTYTELWAEKRDRYSNETLVKNVMESAPLMKKYYYV